MYRETTIEKEPKAEAAVCRHLPEDRRIYFSTHPHTEYCANCGKTFE